MLKSVTFGLCLTLAAAANGAVALKANFEKGAGSMHVPGSCKGGSCEVIAVPDAHSGKKVMSFKAGEKSTVLDSGTMLGAQFMGPKVRLSCFVRGKGTLCAELTTAYCITGKKYKYPSVKAPKEIVLNEQWQKAELEHDFADIAPIGVYVRLRLSPGGEAQVDDILLETIPDPQVKVSALTSGVILKTGSALPACRFAVTPEKTPLQGFLISPDRTFVTKKLPADNAVDFNVKATVPGLYRAGAACCGNAAETFLSVLPEKEYDKLDQAAKKIHFEKPVHVLVLGDSLCDFNRGRNTIDKLVWWLGKYNPGKVSFRNAAVAGDFITRIEARLDGKSKQHRQQMYDNLFDKSYQLIFVAVGANDNYSLKSDKFKKPQIPFDVQTTSMERVLKLLKAKNPEARIILVGPSAAHEAAYQKRKNVLVKFAIPELTHQGIAAQKKAAASCGAEYIDFFEEMRKDAKPDFFARNDVLHLDEAGFNYIAAKILLYLADHPQR